ncbi:MAG: hypothetical protein U0176_22985 [Bacteroidia bacterium]
MPFPAPPPRDLLILLGDDGFHDEIVAPKNAHLLDHLLLRPCPIANMAMTAPTPKMIPKEVRKLRSGR